MTFRALLKMLCLAFLFSSSMVFVAIFLQAYANGGQVMVDISYYKEMMVEYLVLWGFMIVMSLYLILELKSVLEEKE